MLKGYAINQKRLEALDRTVKIHSSIIASTLELDEKEVLNVVEAYAGALSMLDDYDHGCLTKPDGKDTIYRLSYEECRNLIDSMRFESDVFGVEKETGKLEGILAAVYQNVFGKEVYPRIEEKAASLMYFLIKDHPFADGRKRIGATIFLEFLNKNNHLIIDHRQIISNSAMVAITLMIAESRPEEKETMVKLVMNYYCTHQCEIGKDYVPEVKIKELSQIVLETLNLLNQLETRKNKFIEISVDGKITEDEIRDFVDIKIELERISMAIDSLKLWTQKMLSNGTINEDVYKRIESELKASM